MVYMGIPTSFPGRYMEGDRLAASGSGPAVELFKAYIDIKAVCMCLSLRNTEHWSR